MIQILTLYLIGAVGGFLSGLLGIGGGVILIPLLIYVGHVPIKVATSVSMVAIIFASSFGTVAHHRRKSIHVPTGIWMGPASIVGAFAGSIFSGTFPDDFFYYLYMGLVLTAAIILLFPRREDREGSTDYDLQRFPTVLVGFFQGFVTGILGIGGGFIVVVLMIYFLGMPIHQAVGTSLVVTLFSALAGFVGRLATGHFDLHVIIWVVLGTIPATQVGVYVTQRSSSRLLRLFLLILLIGILVWMIRSVLL